ncbi:MAG TPA: MMPL family transporter [Mycobacteriales bacterium]|jgi:RND superfamily putative drug exporter|nr:MMPL family transporter [Mycobacteriales bacterium]
MISTDYVTMGASVTRSLAGLLAGRRSKYLVLVFWVVVVGLAGPLAGKLSKAENNEASSWLPGKAESTQSLKLQEAFQSPNTLAGVVVYERSSGLTAADKAKGAADAQKFTSVGNIDGKITGPIVSKDGKALQTIVPVNLGKDGWDKAPDVADKIRGIARGDAGLTVHITGPLGNASDSGKAFQGIDGTLLYAALAVVIVILLITYRSPILWLLPVLSAGIALGTAEGVIYLLAKHAGVTVNAQSAGILTVLVFGAGTDYALLLVARYREELRRHADRHEAMAVALHRAGPAIIASASTVVVSMLCLMAAESNATAGMGPVEALGVAVALLVMVTLLPALLVICGRWVFWPVIPHHGTEETVTASFWARVGTRIDRRPRMVWVTTTLVLGALAIGITQLHASGLTNAESFRGHPESVVGTTVVARHFDAGAGSPVVIISKAAQAAQVRTAAAGTNGISSVSAPVVKGQYAYLQGNLTNAPDSSAAYDTIDRVRTAVHQVNGADAKVGGFSAVNIDVQRAAKHDRNLIIPIVLIVVLLILMMLLRAVVAPLILIATVVLSFGAALGASSLIFEHLMGIHGSDAGFPLFVFVFLVALGIDYNIFLMTRVREEASRVGTRRGALIGLGATGGVITSAGLVLAGTFAVLGTLPLTAFAEIGTAVALGVLLDTIIVRSVLVTALNLDLGRHMWWPSALSKQRDVDPEELAEERPSYVS